MSHYDFLEKHLPDFFTQCGVDFKNQHAGIVSAHGDKFRQYQNDFDRMGLSENEGTAIGLLTYCHPFSQEVRSTPTGWVTVPEWVEINKAKFLPLLHDVMRNHGTPIPKPKRTRKPS